MLERQRDRFSDAQWHELQSAAQRALKRVGSDVSETGEFHISDSQFGKKIKKHASDWGLSPSSADDRDSLRAIINNIVNEADEVVRDIDWRGYEDEPVVAYIRGDDAVLARSNGEFITIMRGGANNARIKRARNSH